ncbi:MAG: sulfite exporter TauE/SafE family protein [Oscillospiraceae bacterium]|jgi:uncharacterized membrane protein YfcA|nr:sulfite exporter TauE/SafE family protein [Oscillospiraceae bacterium]
MIKNNADKPVSRVKCAVAGLLAGAANGLFGAGGGMFIVPLFTRWVGIDTKRACASSVAAILPLCVVSAVMYVIAGDLDFGAALPYLVGGIVGGVVGGLLFKKVPPKALKRVFALLLIVGGLKTLLS